MLLVLLSIFAEGLMSGLAGSPTPNSAYRSELIGATVLLLLSLLPVLGPGATRGLQVFGVVWAVAGGWFVIAMWQG